MAGTLTAKGTAQTKIASDLTIAGVTIAAGSTILVAIVSETFVDIISWGAESFTEVASGNASTGAGWTYLYRAHNVAGGTNDLQVVFGDSLAQAIAVMELAGCTAAPSDQDTHSDGAGTSPSSGATGTTAQDDEVLVGVVGTNGPSGDTAGTWSNSFNADQRVGTTGGVAATNLTVSTGYLVVAATGAYTAAKTGITSRDWGAIIATFKVAASDLAVTLGAPASVALGVPVALASVTSGVTLGAPAALSIATPSDDQGSVEVLTWEAAAIQAEEGIPITPFTPAALGGSSITSGIHSFGEPYFAMWMQDLSGFGSLPGGECTTAMIFALRADPEMRQSNDEPHWLISVHEVESRLELFSVGVTPDRRLCCKAYDSPIAYSAPGVVPANGQPMLVRMDGPGADGAFHATLDGVRVLSATWSPTVGSGLYSPSGLQTRVMLFNGAEGLTKCNCVIYAAGFYSENFNFIWPLTEGHGAHAHGYEATSGVEDTLIPTTTPDYPDADWTLTAGWYDPSPSLPVWGDVSSGDVSQAFRWMRSASYREVAVQRPVYSEQAVGGGGFDPAEGP